MLIEDSVANLTEQLKEQLKQSPRSGLDNSKRRLLFVQEEVSDVSIDSNESSYDRKMAEKKKKQLAKERALKKR